MYVSISTTQNIQFLTNFAIEFLRLSLKFSVLKIVAAFKTFQGEYGTLGVCSHIILLEIVIAGASC